MRGFCRRALIILAALTTGQVEASVSVPIGASKFVLPTFFEANRGQADARYKFLARLPQYTVLASSDALTLKLPKSDKSSAASDRDSLVQFRFVGAHANRQPKIRGEQSLPSRVNYYLGGQKQSWNLSVPTFSTVRYESLYPGIDLVLRLTQNRLEYDLEVAPGADPTLVRIETIGTSTQHLDSDGILHFGLKSGELTQLQPNIYQVKNGKRMPIAGKVRVLPDALLAFELGDYLPAERLVIDPVINFSTYLGGNRADPTNSKDRVDTIQSVARDKDGAIIVAGQTTSVGFPTASFVTSTSGQSVTTAPYQSVHGGTLCLPPRAGDPPKRPDFDAFIAKFSSTGTLLFATYLGGCGSDAARAVVVDTKLNVNNDIYIAGATNSPDFPTSTAAAQSQLGGNLDGFVVKLKGDGALLYSTFVGGSGDDGTRAIQVDASGGAWVTGFTKSADFPSKCGNNVTTIQCNFGGGINTDAFVIRVASTGKDLTYTTFLGGAGNDWGESLALRPNPANSNKFDILVAGETESGNFPMGGGDNTPYKKYHAGNGACRDTDGDLVGPSHPCRDAYVVMLSESGEKLSFGTFLGGAKDEDSIGVDFATPNPAIAGEVEFWVAGNTRSVGVTLDKEKAPSDPVVTEKPELLDFFPVLKRLTEDPLGDQGQTEPFLSKFSAVPETKQGGPSYSVKLLYSTLIGGSDSDAASEMRVVKPHDTVTKEAVYLVGRTASRDFPTKYAFQTVAVNDDGFLTKIVEATDKSKLELIYSTLIGAEQADYIFGLATDGLTTIVAGGTTSNQFPVTPGAFQFAHGAAEDAFVMSLRDDDPKEGGSNIATDLSLVMSTSSASLFLGKDFRLTLAVTNDGTIAAAGPRVVIEVPAGVDVDTASIPSTCITAKRQLYCDIGDPVTSLALASGSTSTTVITIRPKLIGEVNLRASVLSRTADTNTSNNKGVRHVSVLEAPNRGDLGGAALGLLCLWGVYLGRRAQRFNGELSEIRLRCEPTERSGLNGDTGIN